MKKLLIIIVVIIALGMTTPFFIGNQAEEHFRKLYEDVNAGPDVSVEVTEYNKGWFSSTATVVVNVNMAAVDPSSSDQVIAYLKHNIQHGPLLTQTKALGLGILDVDMRIEVAEDMSDDVPELNKILNEVISFNSRIGMDGNALTLMNINEYQFTEDGTELAIQPGEFEFTLSNQKQINFGGQWSGLIVSENGREALRMGPVKASGDMEAVEEEASMMGLYTGTSSISVGEMVISGPSPAEQFTLQNITMASENTTTEGAMSIKVDMGIDSLDFFGMKFTDFIYNQEMKSLDIPALQKVNTLANQMNAGQVNEQDMQALEAAVMQLLENNPELVISQLGVTTPQGAIESSARVSVNADLIDPKNPMTLLTAVEMEAAGSIPEDFLNSLGIMPMFDPYLAEGIIELESGAVRFDMVFEGGQMMMFGKPYSWARLLN